MNSNKTIYLAGAIMGRSDAECCDWRAVAKDLWKGECLDPMRRDYRGREQEPGVEVQIVEGDLRDILAADGVLVYFDRGSWGTAMEMVYARTLGRPVVAINASGQPTSPWVTYHSRAVITMDGAAQHHSILLRRTAVAIGDALDLLENFLVFPQH